MDAKIHKQKCEKQDICKDFPQSILNYKGKTANQQQRNLTYITLVNKINVTNETY